jgi:hypothetical protein
VKGIAALAELEARIVTLEVDVTVLGSVLEDLQTGVLPGTTGPPTPPPAAPTNPVGGGGGEPEPVEPFYRSLLEFVVEGFAPVYCRATSPTMRWCPSWWDHAEAIYRLEALWRSWEVYRLEPRLGIASWLRDFLDPQLAALTSPTGPFAQCTDDRHSPAKALRTEQPPEDYLDDL